MLPTLQRELIVEIELEPTDPAIYDHFCNDTDEDSWHDVMIVYKPGWSVTWPN